MAYSWQYGLASFLCLLTSLAISSGVAFAAEPEIDVIAKNMVEGTNALPGAIAGCSYLMALLFAVTGVLKLKEHVSNPTQTPLRTPIIRFLVGGGLLALPIVYEAMANAISGGANVVFDPGTTAGGLLSGLLGGLANLIPMNNLNNVFSNIKDSIEETPALIAAVAYMLALLLGMSALLKLKEHVENPEQTPLREPVIRFLVGGALFALPSVYTAMNALIGGTGVGGAITSLIAAFSSIFSSYGMSACNPLGTLTAGFLGGNKLGDVICNFYFSAGAFPAFLTALGYLFGLVLGVWGLLKIKAHVLNPQQTSVWEGISRLVAGGAFFALPAVIEVMRNTMAPLFIQGPAAVKQVTSFNEKKGMLCNGTEGLDGALYCFMDSIFTPMHVLMNFFATAAGFVLAMIAISRLMKGAQDGARAPGGLGTMMTFAASGALLSYNALMRVFSNSLSMTNNNFAAQTQTKAVMQYTKGMLKAEQDHAHTVISAIIKFMIIIGLVSFIRGIFIIRSVAEGNGQASLMAGVTHMVGGALAVNLGPLINAVQSTLGLTQYGITFS